MGQQHWNKATIGLLCGLLLAARALSATATAAASGTATAAAKATAAPSAWHPLVQDQSAPEWRGWKSDGFPPGWRVEGGVLSKDDSVDDLVSKQNFANFELELEWKIGKGGNSGIFYRGTREYDHIYWSGPEYQLLDDANAHDGRNPLTSAAAAYGLYAPPRGITKPFGQWNKTRIVVSGTHVQHWLNGRKVVDYELQSDDWKSKVAGSKFKDYPRYGLASSGAIGIQGDHDGTLAIRNMRIRELP
jgi:hypothetical protein